MYKVQRSTFLSTCWTRPEEERGHDLPDQYVCGLEGFLRREVGTSYRTAPLGRGGNRVAPLTRL